MKWILKYLKGSTNITNICLMKKYYIFNRFCELDHVNDLDFKMFFYHFWVYCWLVIYKDSQFQFKDLIGNLDVSKKDVTMFYDSQSATQIPKNQIYMREQNISIKDVFYL